MHQTSADRSRPGAPSCGRPRRGAMGHASGRLPSDSRRNDRAAPCGVLYHLGVVFPRLQPRADGVTQRSGPDQRTDRRIARSRSERRGASLLAWRRSAFWGGCRDVATRSGAPVPNMAGGPPATAAPRGSHLVKYAGHTVESHDAPTSATHECSVSQMFVKQNLASRLICWAVWLSRAAELPRQRGGTPQCTISSARPKDADPIGTPPAPAASSSCPECPQAQTSASCTRAIRSPGRST